MPTKKSKKKRKKITKSPVKKRRKKGGKKIVKIETTSEETKSLKTNGARVRLAEKNFRISFTKESLLLWLAGILVFIAVFSATYFYLYRAHNEEQVALSSVPTANIEQARINPDDNQEQNQQEEFAEAQNIDSTDWATYTNKYYGFTLKYPPDWNKFVAKSPVRGSNWAQRYQFRKKNYRDNNFYLGFDVVVYDVKKVKELQDTEEFPALKEGADSNTEACQTIEGHLEENPNYPAEEIYIPSSDDCYETTLFYSITRDEYVYNIVPVYTEGAEKVPNLRRQTIKNFPEFFEAAVSFDLTDIVRPKPQPATPKIIAPMPVAAKKVNGKLVCAKKHDKPGYSKKTKHKHLDMECCLDPDEYPNPWCYYDPGKYGKYLK